MPFVKLDENNSICAIAKEQLDNTFTYLHPSSKQLQEYLYEDMLPSQKSSTLDALIHSDRDIARVTEDLVNLLIAKNIILFTELPIAVQNKLLAREKLRAEHVGSQYMPIMDDNDSL